METEPSWVEPVGRVPSLCRPLGTPTSRLSPGWVPKVGGVFPCVPTFLLDWLLVSEVSSVFVFRFQTCHGISVPKRYTVPWRSLEPGCPELVWEAAAPGKLVAPCSFLETALSGSQPVPGLLWAPVVHALAREVGG